jgi:hypothetical protein
VDGIGDKHTHLRWCGQLITRKFRQCAPANLEISCLLEIGDFSWELRLRCSCQFPWCALALTERETTGTCDYLPCPPAQARSGLGVHEDRWGLQLVVATSRAEWMQLCKHFKTHIRLKKLHFVLNVFILNFKTRFQRCKNYTVYKITLLFHWLNLTIMTKHKVIKLHLPSLRN